MTTTLQASPAFRRGVLIASVGVALVELGLFAWLWRLGGLVDPGADRNAALLFVVLGSAVTLQAMGVVGVAWAAVAMSRTVLRHDGVGISLEHPWRRWHGAWVDVTRAWTHGGWLVFQVRGQWRRWYVRSGSDETQVLAQVRAALPPGAWLAGSAKHFHLARTTLPLVLAAAGIGGLILVWVLGAIGSLR
jgi:hypothetical protein